MTGIKEATRYRIRRFRFWRAAQTASLVSSVAFAVLATVVAFASLVFIFLTPDVPMDSYIAFAPLSTAGIFWSLFAYNTSKTKAEKNKDPRFNHIRHDLVLKSLRKLGISRPSEYLEEHPAQVNAYLRVIEATHWSIDAPPKSKLASLAIWKIAGDLIEQHKVAFLVFPGEKELKREDTILHLVEQRGIRTYAGIADLVQQTDDQPIVMNEGAL